MWWLTQAVRCTLCLSRSSRGQQTLGALAWSVQLAKGHEEARSDAQGMATWVREHDFQRSNGQRNMWKLLDRWSQQRAKRGVVAKIRLCILPIVSIRVMPCKMVNTSSYVAYLVRHCDWRGRHPLQERVHDCVLQGWSNIVEPHGSYAWKVANPLWITSELRLLRLWLPIAKHQLPSSPPHSLHLYSQHRFYMSNGKSCTTFT